MCPPQIHSAFRLAYQVGLSGGCSERARVLASNVLHLIRMYISKRLAFSMFSDELDRAFSCFSSWGHVPRDIERLILTISNEDVQTAKQLAKVVKLIAGRNRVPGTSDLHDNRQASKPFLLDYSLVEVWWLRDALSCASHMRLQR